MTQAARRTKTLVLAEFRNGNLCRLQSKMGIRPPAHLHDSATLSMCKLWNAGPLWIARSFLLLAPCGPGRASHIKRPVYTGHFKPPVGDVGNQGHLSPLTTLFSKTPHLHSHDLENSPPRQIAEPTKLETDIHFSGCTTGITALCIYFYLYKSPRRALHCCRTWQHPYSAQTDRVLSHGIPRAIRRSL